MPKKIKNWMDKPLPARTLFVFISLIVVAYLVESLVCKIYDSDMYFLIATGREILENGIPDTNVWHIDNQQGFIAQQWLYTIIIALADKIGHIGFTVLVSVQFIALMFSLNHFFNLRNVSKIVKFVSLCAIVFYSQLYLFCLRPELITMILLVIECIALEHYGKSGKWQWLILLPVTMLAEINLHGSMWPVHYAILLAYLVPSFYLPGADDKSIWRKWKPIALFTAIMTGVMFINPYGLDGILYIVTSFTAKTFSYVDINEVGEPAFISACGLTIMLGIILIFINHKFKHLDSVSLNISLGFIALAIISNRNNVFAIFIFMFLFRNLAVYLSSIDLQSISKKATNSTLLILLIGVIFFVGSSFGSILSVFVSDDTNDLDDIYDYISESYSEDTRIFTGFNCGAYFEWKGFRNLYMDARPELYTDEFTGDKDILRDYSRYCIYGFDAVAGEYDSDGLVTKSEMDEWFYSYDFDYVVVSPYSEQYLSAYMMLNDDYDCVEECTTPMYLLYVKKEVN